MFRHVRQAARTRGVFVRGEAGASRGRFGCLSHALVLVMPARQRDAAAVLVARTLEPITLPAGTGVPVIG